MKKRCFLKIISALMMLMLSMSSCSPDTKIIELNESELTDIKLGQIEVVVDENEASWIHSMGFCGDKSVFCLYSSEKDLGLWIRNINHRYNTVIKYSEVESAAASENGDFALLTSNSDGTKNIIYDTVPYKEGILVNKTPNNLSNLCWLGSNSFAYIERRSKDILCIYNIQNKLLKEYELTSSIRRLFDEPSYNAELMGSIASKSEKCYVKYKSNYKTIFYDVLLGRRFVLDTFSAYETIVDNGVLYTDNMERLCFFDFDTEQNEVVLNNVKLYSAAGNVEWIAWVERGENVDMLYVFDYETGRNSLIDMRSEISFIEMNTDGNRILMRYMDYDVIPENGAKRNSKYSVLTLSEKESEQ